MAKFRQNLQIQAGPWIYNSWLDLIVGCGAWSAPLLLISYFSVASSARAWSLAFYVLALFFNYPHYMATIYRAYHREEDFQKYRVFTLHTTALLVLTLVLSHFWVRLLPWIFTIYLTWSPWHYSGQNYGLLMMFARRAGVDPERNGRRAIYGAFITSYLILFLAFHTGSSTDPLFISLGIPAVVSRWEQMILGLAFVLFSTFGVYGLVRATGWKRAAPCVTLLSSQFLWFLLPATISLFKGLAIPQNRYSTGVLAVMHSAQYLWITSYFARRESAGKTVGGGNATWRPWAYFTVLVLGGIALFVPGPWMASRALHHDFTTSFLIFTALVNIHHFILDGAIWKLRDGRIASLLLNSRENVSQAVSGAGGRITASARWLAGDASRARALRVSAALLLLSWGTIDQIRYYLALRTDNLEALQRAAALNGFDSALQMRLAQRALTDGHTQDAESAWRRAIDANPADPAARQQLLQFLINQSRYGEALKLTDASLQYFPKDANLLVDRGFLNMQRGAPEAARADWDHAIAVDPTQMNAQLYLADELDREGKAQEAASHYTAYLERIARQTKDRPSPEQMIAIVLRLADCQSRSNQPEVALKAYQMAEKLAKQTGQPKLESVADLNLAALQAKIGRTTDALAAFQRAIRLDSDIGDAGASAQDWLTYGRFLEDGGFPPKLAYACVLKSENIFRSLNNTGSLEMTGVVRKELEKRLGAAAAPVRRNAEITAQEALELGR